MTMVVFIETMFRIVFLALSIVPPQRTVRAEIVEWGSDKDVYKVGDDATAWIAIKNTGDTEINTVELQGGIEKEFLGRFIGLIGDRITVPIYKISPGQTERYRHSAKIPNFPGRYRIKIKVLVDGEEIADVHKEITIAR